MAVNLTRTNAALFPVQRFDQVSPLFVPDFLTNLIVVIMALVAISNSESLVAVGILRYLIYIVPVLLSLAWAYYPQCRELPFHQRDFAYVLIMACSFIIPGLIGPVDALRYVVFIGLGFVPFAFPCRIKPKIVVSLFVTLSVCQLLLSAQSGFVIRSLDVESFSSGSAALTHTLPESFGILFGALFLMRRYGLAACCLVMIAVAGKRSVLLATAISFGVMWAYRYKKRRDPGLHVDDTVASVSWILVGLGFIVAVNLPAIYEFVAYAFDLNINVMTSGRYIGQELAFKALYSSDLFNLLFGRGLGQADEYSVQGFQGLAVLIHCDYLRVMLDFGLLSGVVFIFTFMKLVGRGLFGVYLMVHLAYMWLTENNLIIMLTTVLTYLCVCALRADAVGRASPATNAPKISSVSHAPELA